MNTFLFIHGFGRCRLGNIRTSYRIEGITPRLALYTYLCNCPCCNLFLTRIHGNKERLPINTFTPDEEAHIVSFIQNYAETHAILLPGRIPAYKRMDFQLLPSSTTKHLEYVEATESTPYRQPNPHLTAYGAVIYLTW